MTSSREDLVSSLIVQLDELSSKHQHDQRHRLSDRLLGWAMSHPSFKTQLFRFVDVFPAAQASQDVLKHLEEYLELAELPRIVDLGLSAAEQLPFGDRISSAIARRNIERLAQQFIIGATASDAIVNLAELWREGSAFTVDVLGEKTVTDDEADIYIARVNELLTLLSSATNTWPERSILEHDDLGEISRINLSVKPSALSARYAPLTRDLGLADVKARLWPALRRAREAKACINLDMEHYALKDLTLELVGQIMSDPDLVGIDLGIVVQAYLKESYTDLQQLIAMSGAASRPLTVRLVKGAYWDTETVHARAEGWPLPVFEHKAETEANYERCIRLLHDHHGEVRAAFGTHNLRSIAYAIAYARERSIPANGFEIQMLHGMADDIKDAARELGLRLRVYCPVGELVPGMAYLVRRLLENTANESFVRAHLSGAGLDQLIAAPNLDHLPELTPLALRAETDPHKPSAYQPEPLREWHHREIREAFAEAIEQARKTWVHREVAAVINGRKTTTETFLNSLDPSDAARVIARVANCATEQLDQAITHAEHAWPAWRDQTALQRSTVLFKTAAWMRERRDELSALEVYETGKPWAEADADVCESIDYCEYYGREMLRYDQGGDVQSPPGEHNVLSYSGRGIGAVIAPWNFPLAIPTGMTCAALVAGNAVLLKPAEQSPAIASRLVEALLESGLPPGVLAFLPGSGDVTGAQLVERPEISFIAFTGSKAVGLQILEHASRHQRGQRQLKRVVVEMGGKNAIVIDEDADLDQAVPIVLTSAFSYAGQKCSAASRVITVGSIGDDFVRRLVQAAELLTIGAPASMAVSIGPVIDEDAFERIRGYQKEASRYGEVVLNKPSGIDVGYFVGPTIVDRVEIGSRLWTEEIFGPVLAIARAATLSEALDLANDSEYALTAGIVTRSPANIDQATRALAAGNIYVNRPITGAIVGRQAFGGHGLSGLGTKAGGPDYLLQFLNAKVTSENTVRQGFVPEEPDELEARKARRHGK